MVFIVVEWIGLTLLAYLLGAIPSGLIIVKLASGRDVREVASGRTGGTNAMRAAGFWAGLGTAIMDILKSAAGVWIAMAIFPENPWLHVNVGLAAILGHNYSIFLTERDEDGRLRLRGGAGGAPTVGTALAFWAPSILIIVPLAALILYFIGYASIVTLSIALLTGLVFAYRAWIGVSPWQYVLYALLAELLIIWALRPNIQRLISGTERVVGYRARRKKDSSQEVQDSGR